MLWFNLCQFVTTYYYFTGALHTLVERHSDRQTDSSKNFKLFWLISIAKLFAWSIWLYRYTLSKILIWMDVVRSIGQVDEIFFPTNDRTREKLSLNRRWFFPRFFLFFLTWPIWLYRCNVIGKQKVKYEYECNWEHFTAFHTVFYVNVFRSIGQVGKMEFDEIGQRDFLQSK